MSLPQDNTNWNMVTIVILQSTSDTKKLSTTDVTTSLVLSLLTLLLSCALVKHQNQPTNWTSIALTNLVVSRATWRLIVGWRSTTKTNRMRETQRRRTRKGRRLLLTLLKMRLPPKVPLWPLSSSHHSLLMMIVMFMSSLPLRSSPSSLANPAMISSSTLAVPATSVHIMNTSWTKPLPPSRNPSRFISKTCQGSSQRCVKVHLRDVSRFISETCQGSSQGCVNHPCHWKGLTALSHGHSQAHCPCHHCWCSVCPRAHCFTPLSCLLHWWRQTSCHFWKYWLCYYSQILWLLCSHHM